MQLTFSMNFLLQDLQSLQRMRQLCSRRGVAALPSRSACTAAGVIWVYLPPLLTMATYYLVFDIIFNMRLGDQAPARTVGVYMIAGMLPWIAFADAISRGMGSLLEAGSALQKNPLPPVLFLTRTVLASGLIFGPLLLAVFLFYGPQHGFAPLALLSFVLLLLLQAVLCWLVGYLLALLAAAVRDTVQITNFILGIGIFLSPVLFPIAMFPQQWQWALWLNPMTPFVLGYQSALLEGALAGTSVWLAIAVWFSLLALVLNGAIGRTREELIDWL